MLYTIVDKFLMNDFTNLIVDHLNKKNEDEVTIFDIGCFQGNFSRKLKKELKTKKNNFFLFDPNPNLKILDFDYYKLALSNKAELKDYYLNEFFPSSGSSLKTIVKDDKLWNFTRKLLSLNMHKGFSPHKIQTDTLDNFCEKKKIEKIDILKIDAEGSEFDILNGSRNMLKKTNIIQIEILGKKIIFIMFILKYALF